jgi:O-antigen/teichoic acid export membrane protein
MILAVALQLVSVPVCLRFWGEETYGLWLTLFALFNVLRTIDSGFTTYVGNELNLLYHRDQAALRRTLASGLAGSILVAALQFLAAVVIVASGTLGSLLGVPEEAARETRAGLAIVILLLGWTFTGPYLGIVHRLLVPAGMLHQSTWWFMGFQITQTATLVLAAALETSLTGAALLYSAAQFAFYLASAVYVARKLPQFFPWWRHPSRRVAVRDILRSLALVGANFLTQLSTNGLVMLISAGLGAAAVPAFTTVRTIVYMWTTLGSVMVSPLQPEVVRYHANRDANKLIAAQEVYWLIASSTVNLSILACVPFLAPLYRLWTGGRIPLDEPLLCYLLLSVSITTVGSLITTYLVGINQLRAATAIFAARGLVPLALGAVLLPVLGISGVGVAVVLGEVVGQVMFGFFYFGRELQDLGASLAAQTWGPTAISTCALAIFLVARATASPYAGAAYGVAVIGVVGSAAWGWRYVDAEVRDRALRLFRRRWA